MGIRMMLFLNLEDVDLACVLQCLSSVAEPHPHNLSVIVEFSCDLRDLLACGQSVLLKVGVKDFNRLRRETSASFAFFGGFAANKLH